MEQIISQGWGVGGENPIRTHTGGGETFLFGCGNEKKVGWERKKT